MVLAPNDLFSWNNKYNKYNNYTSPIHSLVSPWAMHINLLCACWHHEAMRRSSSLASCHLLTSSHVFSLPLSGLNWCPLFPPWGSGPSFPNMAAPFTGSAHTPLPGSGTILTVGIFHVVILTMFYAITSTGAFLAIKVRMESFLWHTHVALFLREKTKTVSLYVNVHKNELPLGAEL